MHPILDISWIMILIATVLAFLIGWLWYGKLFKEAWKAEQPTKHYEKCKKSMLPMVTQFFATLATAWVAFWMVATIQIITSSTEIAVAVTFLMLGTMIALNMISGGMFQGHSRKLTQINCSYQLLILALFVVMATIKCPTLQC